MGWDGQKGRKVRRSRGGAGEEEGAEKEKRKIKEGDKGDKGDEGRGEREGRVVGRGGGVRRWGVEAAGEAVVGAGREWALTRPVEIAGSMLDITFCSTRQKGAAQRDGRRGARIQ